MVTATCDRVVCTQLVPKIKVLSGQSISLESRGIDSSLRLTLSVSGSNYPLMFYFLRFFRSGTSHRVIGSLNVSAYSFDDSSKAFASVRIGVTSVAPISEVDHEGKKIGNAFSLGVEPVNEKLFPLTGEYLKCKYVLLKYVWDNWENNELVDGKKDLLREPFSDNLEELFEDLVDLKKISPLYNPVEIQEVAVKRLKKNSGSSRAGKKVAIRVSNSKVKKSDICSDLLLLKDLTKDAIAFNSALFDDKIVTSNSSTTEKEQADEPLDMDEE